MFDNYQDRVRRIIDDEEEAKKARLKAYRSKKMKSQRARAARMGLHDRNPCPICGSKQIFNNDAKLGEAYSECTNCDYKYIVGEKMERRLERMKVQDFDERYGLTEVKRARSSSQKGKKKKGAKSTAKKAKKSKLLGKRHSDKAPDTQRLMNVIESERNRPRGPKGK